MPAVRIASLVLASEALWWLGHFEDARRAAQAAADADPAIGPRCCGASRLPCTARAGSRRRRPPRRAGEGGQPVRSRVGATRPGQGLARRGQPGGGAGRLRRRGGADLRFGHLGGAVPDGGCRLPGDRPMQRSGFMTPRRVVPPRPADVVLLPDKSRVERGVDPDRRWHLEGPSTGGGDSDSLFGGLGGDFAAGARSRASFGTRFVLYQRNIENLCKDRTAVGEEIRKSVAELVRRGSRVPRNDRDQGCARANPRRRGKAQLLQGDEAQLGPWPRRLGRARGRDRRRGLGCLSSTGGERAAV